MKTKKTLMEAFDARMRNDSNYMGEDTNALMDLFPGTNYLTPEKWFQAVKREMGIDAIPGSLHHYQRAAHAASHDILGEN